MYINKKLRVAGNGKQTFRHSGFNIKEDGLFRQLLLWVFRAMAHFMSSKGNALFVVVVSLTYNRAKGHITVLPILIIYRE